MILRRYKLTKNMTAYEHKRDKENNEIIIPHVLPRGTILSTTYKDSEYREMYYTCKVNRKTLRVMLPMYFSCYNKKSYLEKV